MQKRTCLILEHRFSGPRCLACKVVQSTQNFTGSFLLSKKFWFLRLPRQPACQRFCSLVVLLLHGHWRRISKFGSGSTFLKAPSLDVLSVCDRRASKAQRALFELLWKDGVVTKGAKLLPFCRFRRTCLEHLSRLRKIFHDSDGNAEANDCHHMAIVSSSADVFTRYHCLFLHFVP